MAAYLTWLEDNSMIVRLVLERRDAETLALSTLTGAAVEAKLRDPSGADLWQGTLDETATPGTYSAIVHPDDAPGADVGPSLTLRVEATAADTKFNTTETVVVRSRSVAGEGG